MLKSFKILLVITVFIGSYTAFAADNQTSNQTAQTQESKYQHPDDFLYEEPVKDLVVNEETGQPEEQTVVNHDDNTENEHPLYNEDL